MNENNNDTAALRRMLREIADLAENASLTGGLASGAPRAIQRYNAVLRQLTESGAVQKGLFEELNPETADFGQLGVDARLLASYLKGQGENGNSSSDASVLIRLAPFIRGEDLAALVKDHIAKGITVSSHGITALAPFLGEDQLGQLVREHIVAGKPAAPAPAAAPQQEERGETLEELAEQLRGPEISREERERIASRIAELAARR